MVTMLAELAVLVLAPTAAAGLFVAPGVIDPCRVFTNVIFSSLVVTPGV